MVTKPSEMDLQFEERLLLIDHRERVLKDDGCRQ